MNHAWRPKPDDITIDACAREGCTCERRIRPNSRIVEYRTYKIGPWIRYVLPRCTGKSMDKTLQKETRS